MSRYRQMQVFEAVVQAGSLAAAARQLDLSPVAARAARRRAEPGG